MSASCWFARGRTVSFVAWGGGFHRDLAIVAIVLFSILPSSGVTTLGWTTSLFCYQYLAFSYVRWYLDPKDIPCTPIFLVGLLVGIFSPVYYMLSGEDSGYLNSPQGLPSMAIGFAMVVAAIRSRPTYNRLINYLASCSFAAYLIQCYPGSWFLLKKATTILFDRFGSHPGLFLLSQLGLAVAFFIAAVLVDTVRQIIFRLTIDKNKGHVFERAWGLLMARYPLLAGLDWKSDSK